MGAIQEANSMTISLQNEIVIVTGGAVRVGRTIALACARAGASVVITYNRSQEQALATVEDLRAVGQADARFEAFRCDVSDGGQVKEFARAVQAQFGGATGLVNSAAIFRRTPFESMTEADFDDHIASNLKGPYLLSKAFGDIFLEAGRGAIVNIADIHGLRPLKNYVPYCVSKAGVVMLTEALAKALAPTVRVNCICPGTILLPSETQGDEDYGDDEASLTARIPLKRLGTPEEIAEAVLFLLGGPSFLSGVVLPVDGAERLR
jgi:NAD(P)-dependent dehydrogenase (short-subunit alcohol dehydrogenase family)